MLIILAMKSTFLFLFAVVALAKTQATDNCSDENVSDRTYHCIRNALLSVFSNTREETCIQLRKSSNCLEAIADECIEVEFRGFVDVELKRMNNMIDNTCSYKALGRLQNAECWPSRVEERTSSCFVGILRLIRMDDPPEEQVCSELKNAEKCLRALADDCLTESQRVLVEEQFRRLNARMRPLCADTDSSDHDDDIDACMDAHKDYLHDCLQENQIKAISHFWDMPNPNRNVMTCTLYNWISECVIERVDTKCGVTARNKMRDDLNKPSAEVKEACKAANMDYRH